MELDSRVSHDESGGVAVLLEDVGVVGPERRAPRVGERRRARLERLGGEGRRAANLWGETPRRVWAVGPRPGRAPSDGGPLGARPRWG